MKLLAPAKLTLSLRITGVSGGLHTLESEMVSLDFYDELTISEGSGFRVVGASPDVPADSSNTVCKALELVGKEAFVELKKNIPSQAGLGGGSADAAAILRWANCSDVSVAEKLGSDVPFCLVGGRARVSGTGEQITPLPFREVTVTLLTPPDLVCNTAEIYRMWDVLGAPVGENKNDLEPAALKVVPELASWRDKLADDTGQQPYLAGSGSTWFVYGSYPGEGKVVCRSIPSL